MNNNKKIIHVALPNHNYDSFNKYFASTMNENFWVSNSTNKKLYNDAVRQIFSWENYYYQKRKQGIFDQLSDLLNNEHIESIVISVDEAYSSIGTKTSSYYIADRDIIPKRLKEFFPDAQILIPIQNQFSLYFSIWEKLYKFEFFNKDYEFSDWIKFYIERHQKYIENILYCGDYFSLVTSYKKNFENVLICPVELIHTNSDVDYVLHKIKASTYEFLHEDKMNAQCSNVMKKYSKNQIKFINSFTDKSNKNLQECTGINLVQLGYPCMP